MRKIKRFAIKLSKKHIAYLSHNMTLEEMTEFEDRNTQVFQLLNHDFLAEHAGECMVDWEAKEIIFWANNDDPRIRTLISRRVFTEVTKSIKG